MQFITLQVQKTRKNAPAQLSQVYESEEESEVESVDLEADVDAMIFGSNHDTSDSECTVTDDQ